MLIKVKFGSTLNGGKIATARVISTQFYGRYRRMNYDYNREISDNANDVVQELMHKLDIPETDTMKMQRVPTPDGYIYSYSYLGNVYGFNVGE